ncbi:hypothetical protein CPC08DRAFT_209510 [Agrocybe pediades]|nr:hypothetical protein CPC08DRAFT_209510 [Agrocybe pediades]
MTASTTSSSSHHANVVPSEVGWQFVPQYYTFVNKEPHRLHCFYSKNSTFSHGTEGEEVKPCYGQQEIHNKITSIGFEDCKVFIHSVDAQSSANGGIFIQVIGEMSNHGEPWRKFAQSFFLAEQPNGYFVLNDIFRFLKEETVDGDDASETAESETVASTVVTSSETTAVSTQPLAAPEPVYEPPREPTPPPAPAPVAEPPAPAAPQVEEAPAPEVAEPAITQTPTPAPEQQQPQQQQAPAAPAQPNGIHTPEPEVAAQPPSPKPVPQQEQPAAAAPAAPAPAPARPAAAAPAAPAQPVAAPQPARPAVPAAPRSWASLAASNPKKWGPAVAQEARGTTETVSTAAAPAPQPSAPSPSPAAQRPQGQQQNAGREPPALVAAQSVTTAQCFVKGVTEPISPQTLSTTLTQRFGPIKDIEIVRAKACAFIEFQTVDAAKKAIIASLNQNQGGEGGVWIDVGGDVGQVRISVETKKERGDRPPTRPRGGAPAVNGDGRGAPGGGFRGRGRGAGRGGPAAK